VPDFDTVYREQRPVVYRWVAWRYGETLADDVVQEAFLQAWLKWGQIDAVENIRRWLIGIAKFVARHMVRATGTLSRGGAAITIPWEADADVRVDPASPELSLYVTQLRDHFGCLGPTQREALTALADGDTAQEFAERTGRSQQAVSEAVRLGRRRMRERLGDDFLFVMS
jgi:RNA polymerase sigma factor (sigma-70 family)